MYTAHAIWCVKNSTNTWNSCFQYRLHHCRVYCAFQGGPSMLTCLCYFTPSREALQSMWTKIWTLSQFLAFWLNELSFDQKRACKNIGTSYCNLLEWSFCFYIQSSFEIWCNVGNSSEFPYHLLSDTNYFVILLEQVFLEGLLSSRASKAASSSPLCLKPTSSPDQSSLPPPSSRPQFADHLIFITLAIDSAVSSEGVVISFYKFHHQVVGDDWKNKLASLKATLVWNSVHSGRG